MAQDEKIQGVVSTVGLERDEQEYRNFNITVGIKIKTDKKISYAEGEQLMKQFQKELMGKNIELETVSVPCPICGRTFNSQFGMEQHKRIQHKEEEKPKKQTRRKKIKVDRKQVRQKQVEK